MTLLSAVALIVTLPGQDLTKQGQCVSVPGLLNSEKRVEPILLWVPGLWLNNHTQPFSPPCKVEENGFLPRERRMKQGGEEENES